MNFKHLVLLSTVAVGVVLSGGISPAHAVMYTTTTDEGGGGGTGGAAPYVVGPTTDLPQTTSPQTVTKIKKAIKTPKIKTPRTPRVKKTKDSVHSMANHYKKMTEDHLKAGNPGSLPSTLPHPPRVGAGNRTGPGDPPALPPGVEAYDPNKKAPPGVDPKSGLLP